MKFWSSAVILYPGGNEVDVSTVFFTVPLEVNTIGSEAELTAFQCCPQVDFLPDNANVSAVGFGESTIVTPLEPFLELVEAHEFFFSESSDMASMTFSIAVTMRNSTRRDFFWSGLPPDSFTNLPLVLSIWPYDRPLAVSQYSS